MQSTSRRSGWAASLFTRFASGASGQFILCGNVHDQMPLGGRLVSIERYLQDELLSSFEVIVFLRPRQRPHGRARWRAAGGMGAVRDPQPAARAAGSDPLRQPVCALSRQSRRPRPTRHRACRRHHSRRGSASPRGWQRLRARQSHESRARVGLRPTVHAAAVREPADRGQSERPRAADRLSRRVPRSCVCRCQRLPNCRPRSRSCRRIFRKTILPGTDLSSLAALDDRRVGQRRSSRSPKVQAHSRQGAAIVGPRGRQERDGRAGGAGPHRVRRVLAHAGGLSRPRHAEEMAAPGREALARQRSQGAADGLPAVRPHRHRQDFSGRVPGGRGQRAGREAEQLPREVDRLERGQPREDFPADPGARPLHRVRRRGGSDARAA